MGTFAWADDSEDYVYHLDVKPEIKARLFSDDKEARTFTKVDIVEDEEETPNAEILARKKGGKGKHGSKLGTDNAANSKVPPCRLPACSIKDPILPDEICKNDCPGHCQGRHYTEPIEINIALCI